MKSINYFIALSIFSLISLQGQIEASSEEEYDLMSVHGQNWAYYAQEPIIDLKMARAAFNNEDYESAAYSLRQVNAYLMLEALRLDQGEDLLSPIIKDINGLVKKLGSPESVSQKEYDTVLGEVNLTLSAHYHDLAKKAWNNDKPVKAGYSLQASTLYLERAEQISNNSFTDENKSIINESKDLSKELINGDGNKQDETVRSKMKAFGRALKEFKNKSSEEFRLERSF